MKKNKIAIIGGGCSGLFLANLLNKNDIEIYIFEKNNKLGKKILASGNGKCNFTNVGCFENKYNNKIANYIIERFDVNKTLNEFKKMGLIYKNDDQGRCYPVSECSTSVLDCLKLNLKNTHILLDSEVKNIEKNADGYIIKYGNKKEFFDYIACCSGSAASNLGSQKAYSYLANLNVQIKDLSASLVPVIVKEKISSLKGVRVKCGLKLIDNNGVNIYEENGEVLFREDSLSGIAVFNASNFINRKKGEYKIVLDLSSQMSKIELKKYMLKRKNDYSNIFKGFLNDRIGEYILSISKNNIDLMVDNICNLEFTVKGLYSLFDGQVCSGGISLSCITNNLELKKYPNIYIAGELLDIDGLSGGYNMQFAWSCAGVIAHEIKKKLGYSDESK